MTRKVLLTGAGGFIGSHVLAHLLAGTDWDVIATDSFRHKGKTDRITQTLAGGPSSWLARVTVLTHDLAGPVSSQLAHRIGAVDYVLALASRSHVDASIRDPAGFCRNNAEVALTTLQYARLTGPEALIWVSTDEVYGPAERGQGHAEWAPILPSNPYAASKAAQEALAISYWRTYGVPLIIVNCMNLIGEMQDREKYLPSLIGNISAGRQVTVHGVPGNIGSRYYLHARNLADAMLFILRERGPSPFIPDGGGHRGRPDRYNVVGPDLVTNLELAQQVAAIMGKPLSYRLEDFHSTRPGHDPHYGLDGGKLAGLGWKPPVPFAESLARTVLWTLSHPEWLLP